MLFVFVIVLYLLFIVATQDFYDKKLGVLIVYFIMRLFIYLCFISQFVFNVNCTLSKTKNDKKKSMVRLPVGQLMLG